MRNRRPFYLASSLGMTLLVTDFVAQVDYPARVNAERSYHVYAMQSLSGRALYIGVTSNLHKRVFEHKHHRLPGFSDRYNTVLLVFFEQYSDIRSAIQREKQLKGWSRPKKDALINRTNPLRLDLAIGWYESHAPARTSS